MTKKYTVESSTIVRKILGRPSGSDNPVLKLTKTITAKTMASKCEIHVERGIMKSMGDKLPKNRDSDIYANSKRGDLLNMHRLKAWRGICGIS